MMGWVQLTNLVKGTLTALALRPESRESSLGDGRDGDLGEKMEGTLVGSKTKKTGKGHTCFA